MPLISIIMPVYNGARFLQHTLDSLLAQTCGDWELIVVDDGSTDTTPELLAQYDDQRFIKIRKDNGGEAHTRNVGLKHASGEFIAFLDADDLYLPTALADMAAFLAAHREYDAAFSDGYLCDENDQILSRLTEHRSGVYTGNILEPLVLTADVITVPVCTLTRRMVIQQHQIEFDEKLVIGPDWDFWIRLARYAHFGYLDKPTCMYRVHLTNITRTAGIQKRRADLLYGRLKVLNASWFPESIPIYAPKILLQPARRTAGPAGFTTTGCLRSPELSSITRRKSSRLIAASGHVGAAQPGRIRLCAALLATRTRIKSG